MGIFPNSLESKNWHANGVTSDYTLCGVATADGQDIESRDSNIVTCPVCIRIIREASKYKIPNPTEEDYISKRINELGWALANCEDELDNYPSDECEERKEELKLLVEIGRAKIKELKRLQDKRG